MFARKPSIQRTSKAAPSSTGNGLARHSSYDKHHVPAPITTASGVPQKSHRYHPSQPSFLVVPSPTTPSSSSSDTPTQAVTPGAVSRPDSPSLSVHTVQRVPSLSRIDPFARVFPLPPTEGGPSAVIRPGSVRSISFERGAKGESPDDDRGSRRSIRSTNASIKSPGRSVLPPLPAEQSLLSRSASRSAMQSETKTSAAASASAQRSAARVRKDELRLEQGEAADRVGALPGTISSLNADGLGVIGSFDKRLNRSVMSLGSKSKAEKVLDADPQPRLACLYLVSGLGKDPSQWALSDKDATIGVQPLEDSLSVFWRPDMLGSTFSGEKSEDWGKKGAQRSMNNTARRDVTSRSVPGTGPEGPSRLVARTMKYAHPKDVEVVNSTLAPPTTCHTFTFSVSRQSTLSAMAAQQRKSGYEQTAYNTYEPPGTVPPAGQEHLRGTTSSSDLVFYGVTLTVWSHADKERSQKLKDFKRRQRVDSVLSETAARERAMRRRTKTPWMPMNMTGRKGGAASDYTASETGMSDSDLETTFTTTDVDYSIGDMSPAYGENCDVFWLPYALTLVSRYPIYDVMQDYLRLSWARYSKDARAHMRQIFALLNTEAPRPGDLFRLPIGLTADDEVSIEAVMPGALDFDKGTIKVDFQLWPLFQALDIDHILTCVEVALSNSGRVIFSSRHPAMLGAAVETLKYIVELRGWSGIALPNIHARDTTFLIEDPGPYIIGIATECRYVVTPPPEVVIVDLDMNSLTCKALPLKAVTPRQKREKTRAKLQYALGPNFPFEKSIPTEYRISFPKGSFRNIHRINHTGTRPRYLSERLATPVWWNQSAVIAVFDKIMADKHKKPSLFQRLTKSGFARAQEQLTANERLAKAMMRKRALHYVEKRDDFELKVARITRRLQKLVQEGEQWKQRFETFEKYAERLSREAEDLKSKIDREQREARRLSNINNQQEKANAELQEKLVQTEGARAEAMRQLSDMHHSIQELERERNEIMDIIEMQITSALQHLPYLDLDNDSRSDRTHTNSAESAPTSPRTVTSIGTAAGGSVRPRKHRAGTRDSTQSTYTVDTSKAMSVIGQLNEGSVRRGLGSILDLDQVSNADRVLAISKSDSITSRVAIIQAKLELALTPVHQMAAESQSDETHVSSADTSTEAVVDDTEAPTVKETPPSRTGTPDSSHRTTVAVTAPSDDGSGASDADFVPSMESTPRRGVTTMRSRPHTFRPVVLRPPPRRVTQKKSYESIDQAAILATQQAAAERSYSPGSRPGSRPTSALSALSPRNNREIILTPVDYHDRSSNDGHGYKESHVSMSMDDRPASIISTTTVAFGV